MTDTEVRVDLDDYLETLNELNAEIASYGTERRSLADLTSVLKEVHIANERLVSGVEANLSANATVLEEVRDLRLSELQSDVRDRYDTHQQTLANMATSLQQAVHEQQRAALEMLQNATHNTQQLERYAERVDSAFTMQGESEARILAELTALTSEQASIVQRLSDLATDHEAIKATLATSAKQTQVIRTLVIVALILVFAVGIVATVL